MRVLLLGESPNAAVESRPELWLLPDGSQSRHTANRLLEYAGYDMAEYLRTFAIRDNIVPYAIFGRTPWPGDIARCRALQAAEVVKYNNLDGLVVLGRRAARAFMWRAGGRWRQSAHTPFCFWTKVIPSAARGSSFQPVMGAVVPHPSGRCRWWNDDENKKIARIFFSRLVS